MGRFLFKLSPFLLSLSIITFFKFKDFLLAIFIVKIDYLSYTFFFFYFPIFITYLYTFI